MLRFLLFILVLLLPFGVFAKTVKVVDGDSLEIDGTRVRLEGIDAPEYFQTCTSRKGEKYDCGRRARQKMEKMIKGKELECEDLGRDIYKRMLAVCYVNEVNINKEMVASGWAVAYGKFDSRFEADERLAKKNKRGLWQGKFMRPELYRFLNKR